MSDRARGQAPSAKPSRSASIVLAPGAWRFPAAGSIRTVLVMCGLLVAATGCEWFTDFKRQPDVVTWESWRPDSLGVRGAPQGSVPTDGTAMPAWMVSYSALPPTIDSLAGIVNPVAVTEESLRKGRMQFQINCAVCHGDNADGIGNATRFGFPAISLQTDLTKNRTDGYIFGMIRNGRGLMPPYNRIEERDRWDVVNYLRALQGRATGIPFERGPLARPGVTGDRVPGPSTLGPNRAIPYRPSGVEGASRPGGGGDR